MSGLFWVLAAPSLALTAAIGGITLFGSRDIQRQAVSLLLVLSGLSAVIAGLAGLLAPPVTATLPIGLPWLPMHIRLDALAGFFLLVIGLLVIAVSLYSVGYLRQLASRKNLTTLHIFLPLFITGMLGVVIADDAYSFMIFWELMSVTRK